VSQVNTARRARRGETATGSEDMIYAGPDHCRTRQLSQARTTPDRAQCVCQGPPGPGGAWRQMEAPQRLPARLSPAARSPLPPRLTIKYCRLVAVCVAVYRTYRGTRAIEPAQRRCWSCVLLCVLWISCHVGLSGRLGGHGTASPDSAEIANASRLDSLASAGGLLQRQLRPVRLLVLSEWTA